MKQLTIYSRPSCGRCTMFKKFLISKGIEYTDINIDNNLKQMKKLMENNFSSLPVFEIDGELFKVVYPLELLKKLEG